MSRNIVITGSTGLVGSRVIELLRDRFTFTPLLHTELDLSNKDAVVDHLKTIEFDTFLHCAAYTNVDGAERERDAAFQANVQTTRTIADVTNGMKKHVVYLSTDFVFDGTHPPYTENSTPNPVGYYGQTKYEGEQVLPPDATIARISYPYRASFEKKTDLIRFIKSALEARKPLKMITDSLITPTFIDDIALGLGHLLDTGEKGTFHLVGSKSYSPYDTARAVAETFQLDSSLITETTFDEFYKGNVIRPKLSQITSVNNTFQTMRSLEESLEEIKRQLAR